MSFEDLAVEELTPVPLNVPDGSPQTIDPLSSIPSRSPPTPSTLSARTFWRSST